MQRVSESMAGRAAVLQLYPLSSRETPRVTVLRGGYPEVLARPAAARLWFASYLQTYLERDVRSVMAVRDLATFRRFLSLVASRHGQVLNKTDLAAPLGVSVPTITQWLGVLEKTAQILLVPPFYENFGKRLIKSPKVYLADSGLACYLLGIRSRDELARSPFRGALFEGLVAAEIAKAQLNAGGRKELYFFRDRPGLEVDFLFPRGGSLWLVEAKASGTVFPSDARAVRALMTARKGAKSAVGIVVHQETRNPSPTSVLAEGVRALPLGALVSELNG